MSLTRYEQGAFALGFSSFGVFALTAHDRMMKTHEISRKTGSDTGILDMITAPTAAVLAVSLCGILVAACMFGLLLRDEAASARRYSRSGGTERNDPVD